MTDAREQVALVRREPQALKVTSDQVKADLQAARERVRSRLNTLEGKLNAVRRWQEVVWRRPVLTFGAAFLVGYAVARLFSRR